MLTDVPKTKADHRHAEIMKLLMAGGLTQVRDLAETLNVSQMTIHRDLRELHEQGLVRRVRGAVSAEKSMLFESSYQFRAGQRIDEKRRLARAAIAHIEPGNAVIWDDSTTTFHVCEHISDVVPITVITLALPVIEALHKRPGVDLIALGGRYHRAYNGFFGLACEQAIRSFHVDVALMSTTTIEGLSLYTQDEQVVRAKRAMMEVAHKKVLLVDESKFHYSALNYVAELTDFDHVLIPSSVDDATVKRLTMAGVHLEIV